MSYLDKERGSFIDQVAGGDMLKAIYDPDKDGIIALAQLVDAVCSETEADSKISSHAGVSDAHHAKTVRTAKPTDTLQHSNDPNVETRSASYIKAKEILLNGDINACRLKMDVGGEASFTGYAKVYKNGVPIGTERSVSGTSYETFSEDFTNWVAGDLIQLYSRGVSGSRLNTRNMRLCFDFYLPATNQDP